MSNETGKSFTAKNFTFSLICDHIPTLYVFTRAIPQYEACLDVAPFGWTERASILGRKAAALFELNRCATCPGQSQSTFAHKVRSQTRLFVCRFQEVVLDCEHGLLLDPKLVKLQVSCRLPTIIHPLLHSVLMCKVFPLQLFLSASAGSRTAQFEPAGSGGGLVRRGVQHNSELHRHA